MVMLYTNSYNLFPISIKCSGYCYTKYCSNHFKYHLIYIYQLYFIYCLYLFIIFIYYIYTYIYIKMESGLTMLVHSAVIGVILYVIMVYVLKQRRIVAENRSIVLAAIVLIYMVMFGHGMPNKVNSDLF